MKQVPWIWVAVGTLILLSLGIFLGMIIQLEQPVVIDNKIRYSELLNWITTIVIGIWVGFVLKNQFENNKTVKGYLFDDLKKISSEIIDLKEYIQAIQGSDSFVEEQRRNINSKINSIDKKITVFCSFFEDCFGKKCDSLNNDLIKRYNEFNRAITGDGLYAKPFPRSYFDDISKETALFESLLRKLTLSIIKNF